jgi:hypothetical protein
MLKRALEWYRVVNVSPTATTIEARSAAARDIVSAIHDADSWGFGLGLVSGVASGFERLENDDETVVALVDAIRSHDSTFPSDIAENATELRVCAALGLGEFLSLRDEEADEPDEEAVVLASVTAASLGLRPLPDKKHLRQVLEELSQIASNASASAAIARRARSGASSAQAVLAKAPADLTAAINALKDVATAIDREMEIQREEVDILWWVFGGVSVASGKRLESLPIGYAAAIAGAELGNRCLLPHAPNIEALLQRAMSSGRKTGLGKALSIVQVAGDWNETLERSMVPDTSTEAYSQRWPTLFPISWLCHRLISSKNSPGWEREFENITQVPTEHALPPQVWAMQALRERTAIRALPV